MIKNGQAMNRHDTAPSTDEVGACHSLSGNLNLFIRPKLLVFILEGGHVHHGPCVVYFLMLNINSQ